MHLENQKTNWRCVLLVNHSFDKKFFVILGHVPVYQPNLSVLKDKLLEHTTSLQRPVDFVN